MAKNVAEQFIDILEAAGVRRIYGVVGDSLNGLTDAIRKRSSMEWIHVRHEEVAAFAAGAEAHLTGSIAVCAGSCGPGNLHLINGLFDCHRSRVPVLAIAAQIPSPEIGSGYFQETHPQEIFHECSHYCELISDPSQMPRSVEIAIRTAIGERGVSVIAIPGDIALRPVANEVSSLPSGLIPSQPVVTAAEDDLTALAELLNDGSRVTIFCGSGCAAAHEEVIALAEKLRAPVVHALKGKEYVEYDNPYDVGITGLIGFSSGYYAMTDTDVLLMLGTDFPYRQFYPNAAGVRIAQIDIRPSQLGRRVPLDIGIVGDIGSTIRALLPRLDERSDSTHLHIALEHYKETRKDLDNLAIGRAGKGPIHPQQVAKAISDHADDDAIFTFDVGLPTVWAARYLKMNGQRRLIGSLWHGSMANAMPMAIGAQTSHPERQVVSLSGDGGLAMLMGDLLTLRQYKLPAKIVVFNNGSLGFVEVEQKSTGFLPFGTDLDNPDFAALAEALGIKGIRVEDPGEVEQAIREAFAHDGPVLVDAVVARTELPIPPKINLEMAKGFTLYMLKAVMSGRMDEIIELAETNFPR